jgi:hypothetical protein
MKTLPIMMKTEDIIEFCSCTIGIEMIVKYGISVPA